MDSRLKMEQAHLQPQARRHKARLARRCQRWKQSARSSTLATESLAATESAVSPACEQKQTGLRASKQCIVQRQAERFEGPNSSAGRAGHENAAARLLFACKEREAARAETRRNLRHWSPRCLRPDPAAPAPWIPCPRKQPSATHSSHPVHMRSSPRCTLLLRGNGAHKRMEAKASQACQEKRVARTADGRPRDSSRVLPSSPCRRHRNRHLPSGAHQQHRDGTSSAQSAVPWRLTANHGSSEGHAQEPGGGLWRKEESKCDWNGA